ncbi:MAG TPA: tetratricopeptide repeat protein, partial [Armatimonadota bacterium]|nr:tetratricopeptide repeat protein [Armatimonadota bacterium]
MPSVVDPGASRVGRREELAPRIPQRKGAAATASSTAARRARSPALTNFDSRLRQALQSLETDRPHEAVARLREQVQHEPSNAGAYAALGIALAQMGEIPEALEALERAHYLQPESPRILYNYGLALEKAGRSEAARFRFAAAVKLDPLYEPALKRLARGLRDERAPRTREPDALAFGAAEPPPSPRPS